MNQLSLTWELYEDRIDSVKRYCSGCGNKVTFYDSMIRRHNANGKKIFQYAIYKCEKGHTWNKVLNKYLSKESNALSQADSLENNPYMKKDKYKNEGSQRLTINKFSLSELSSKDIERVDIFIRNESCKIRLDNLLAENLTDLSRTQIQKKIKKQRILVNEGVSKPKYFVKNGDKITIFI